MYPNPSDIPEDKKLKYANKEDVLKDLFDHLYLHYCDKEKVQAFSEHWVATIWDGHTSLTQEIKREVYWDWNEWIGWVL